MAVTRITLLGSTGSIGQQTVRLLEENRDAFDVVALTAHENVERLIEQAKTLHPHCVVVGNAAHYARLKEGLQGLNIEVAAGEDALLEVAARPTDKVVAAIMGFAGLAPTLAAVRQGHTVALANKESLVAAGHLVMRLARESGSRILPIDSEHNAIYQVFPHQQPEQVEQLILTASGGPFRAWDAEAMAHATPAQAVNHPNWAMGAKISVDSATLMNKGLECIEAFHLFPVTAEQIGVLVHPQSIVHSLVYYRDGSVLAQMGLPDMTIPIAYTLAWPERMRVNRPRLDLATLGQLQFEAPDVMRFPCLKLALEVLKQPPGAATILNAANEVAVEAFLQQRIGFMDIAACVAEVLQQLAPQPIETLDAVFAQDAEARAAARQWVQSVASTRLSA